MKWYLKPLVVIIAILAVGPFAIPLIWMSPAFRVWLKIALTIAVILLTIISLWLFNKTARLYGIYMKELQDIVRSYR